MPDSDKWNEINLFIFFLFKATFFVSAVAYTIMSKEKCEYKRLVQAKNIRKGYHVLSRFTLWLKPLLWHY